MADGSKLKIGYIEESSWGVTPSAAMKDLPYVDESLFRDATYVTSRIVRSDRQVVDSILTNASAQGDINFELLYKGTVSPALTALDDMLRAGLFSAAWTSVVTNTAAFTTNSGTGKILGTGVGTGLVVGDWIRTRVTATGPVLQAPSYHIITVRTSADDITVSPAPVTGTASEVEGGSYIKNGVTNTSFSFQKEYVGMATATFADMLGMMVDRLSLNIGIGGPINGTLGFIGKNETANTATLNVGTELTPSTNRVFNSVSGVKQFMVGSALSTLQINSWGMDLRNNLTPLLAVGTLGAIQIGTGVGDLTGRLSRYFDNMSEYTAFLGDTESQIAVAMEDPAGNGFVVHTPGIVYTSGRRVGGGTSTQIMADMTWQARASTRYTTAAAETVRITRWDV